MWELEKSDLETGATSATDTKSKKDNIETAKVDAGDLPVGKSQPTLEKSTSDSNSKSSIFDHATSRWEERKLTLLSKEKHMQ